MSYTNEVVKKYLLTSKLYQIHSLSKVPVKSYTNVFNNCLILTETTTFDIPYYKELKLYLIFFFKKNSNIFCKELVFTTSHPKRNKEKNNGPLQKFKLAKHIFRIT